MGQLDGPTVVLLVLFVFLGGCDGQQLFAPLSDGESFEVVMFWKAASSTAPGLRIRPILYGAMVV